MQKQFIFSFLILLLIFTSSCTSHPIEQNDDSSVTVNAAEALTTESEVFKVDATISESEIQTEARPLADESLFGTYIYEGKGAGGDFCITIHSDGTFYYYEGGLSSYIGIGDWTIDGDMLCIDDSSVYRDHIHYFKVSENQLTFVAEGSNNFIYVRVSDGERFIKQTGEQTD